MAECRGLTTFQGQREGLRRISLRLPYNDYASVRHGAYQGAEEDYAMPEQILTDDRQEALLTPNEVAEILRVKPARVLEAARDGRLRAVKWGKFVRFRRQDVETFIERHVQGKR